MGLNKTKGNMYEFISHTWNPIKGKCLHDCFYCYMKRWGVQKPVHFDDRELKTEISGCGKDHFIFVGSSCDLFANDVPEEWLKKVFNFIRQYPYAKYLFQTKNPKRMLASLAPADTNIILCTTIETNRVYKQFMGNTPSPKERVDAFSSWFPCLPLFITIEPVMDFDLEEFVGMLRSLPAHQINIGADSGRNGLPEPPREKLFELIAALGKFTEVVQKPNLKRLLMP